MAIWGGSFGHTNVDNNSGVIDNAISQRETARGNSDHPIGTGPSNYDIVGMDITKVQPAITAIDKYVADIERQISIINEGANSDVFVKGEDIKNAIKYYIGKVEEYCTNLTSNLRGFKESLTNAQKAWEKFEQGTAENISSDSNSINTGNYRAS